MSTMLSQQLDLAETAAQATERAKEELERVTTEVEQVARHLEELGTIQKFAAHSFAVL
jgi:archaellum component FlaC